MSDANKVNNGNGTQVAVHQVDMPLDYAVIEHVLGTGDLSKLTTQQRTLYYQHTCKSLGLNPATRPFRFMSFQGQTVMYATKDAADQLRKLHTVNLSIVEQRMESDLFMVTVRATIDAGKRHDEDIGAVPLSAQLRGEARANAIMKCITKAKRRVTLSICGLGYNDESEVEALQGAKTFDHDEDAPTTPDPVVTKPTPPQRGTNGNGQRTLRMVLDSLKAAAVDAKTPEDVQALRDDDDTRKLFDMTDPRYAKVQAELRMALDEATDRVSDFWGKLADRTTDALPPDPADKPAVDADARRVELMCIDILAASSEDAIDAVFSRDENVNLVNRFARDGLTHHIWKLEAARKQRQAELKAQP